MVVWTCSIALVEGQYSARSCARNRATPLSEEGHQGRSSHPPLPRRSADEPGCVHFGAWPFISNPLVAKSREIFPEASSAPYVCAEICDPDDPHGLRGRDAGVLDEQRRTNATSIERETAAEFLDPSPDAVGRRAAASQAQS